MPKPRKARPEEMNFSLPAYLKGMEGRQVAIALENLLDDLRTELNAHQKKEFSKYWGQITIVSRMQRPET